MKAQVSLWVFVSLMMSLSHPTVAMEGQEDQEGQSQVNNKRNQPPEPVEPEKDSTPKVPEVVVKEIHHLPPGPSVH